MYDLLTIVINIYYTFIPTFILTIVLVQHIMEPWSFTSLYFNLKYNFI